MAGVDQLAVVARQRLEPADRRSRRRSPIRSRPRAARAGCRALRGRSRRRSRASPAPDGSRVTTHALLAPMPRWSRQRRSRIGQRRQRRSSAGGRSRRRRSNQPGSGSIARRAARLRCLQPLEHLEILPLDDRPVVVVAEELPAVAAERCRPASGSARSRRSVADELARSSRSTARRCCGCTGPSARRTCRWRAPACRAPRLRARPSTGSRSTTA